MLEPLFNPKAVAVTGASTKELHVGNRVVKNLLDGVQREPGVDNSGFSSSCQLPVAAPARAPSSRERRVAWPAG